MRPFNVIIYLLVGFLCLPCLLSAQTITRDEFLQQLILRHPLFEKEKLTRQIIQEDQKSILGNQDWNVYSSVNYTHEEPVIALAGPKKTDALSVSGGIERLFWITGGKLSASFTSSRADIEIDPFYGFPNSFYQNKIEVTYTHPLLKNRNGFLDRLQYDLKKFDIDFSEIQSLENREDFLASSAAKFLDWVFLTEQKRIVLDRLQLSEEELARTRKKREANLVDQADVIRAEDAVRIWKQNQVLVESQWKALQAELAVLSQDDGLYKVSPEFGLYTVEESVPLEEAIQRLKENSRLIKVLNVRLEQLEHIYKGFEEASKPELSLVAQLNIKNLDEGLSKSLEMDKPDVIVGLQLSLPLGNRTARSHMSMTDLQISQLKSQLEELTLTLVSALTSLYIQIKELEKVLKLNQEQIESSKERTKEELKLYNRGRGELTFVILSRDNENNAKLTYALNALTYHKLIIEYRALMDQLYR